jgi:hypothetical protein
MPVIRAITEVGQRLKTRVGGPSLKKGTSRLTEQVKLG